MQPEKLHASMVVPAAPLRVPIQRPLASSFTLMIRGIMKWSRGLFIDLMAFAIQLRKTPKKPQLRDRLMKGLYDQSSPQMGSLSYKWGRQDRKERQEGRRLYVLMKPILFVTLRFCGDFIVIFSRIFIPQAPIIYTGFCFILLFHKTSGKLRKRPTCIKLLSNLYRLFRP